MGRLPAGLLLPVGVLSRLFRRLFLQGLQKAFVAGKLAFFSALQGLRGPVAFRRYWIPARKAEWVVYAKPPFGGPQRVLEYVGRYTHRMAIANDRLISIEDSKVRFRWKDYRDGEHAAAMTLAAGEFIRRFLLHVLPEGFQRIRYYGFLCNRYREQKLARCRELLGASADPSTQEPPEDSAVTMDEDHWRLAQGLSRLWPRTHDFSRGDSKIEQRLFPGHVMTSPIRAPITKPQWPAGLRLRIAVLNRAAMRPRQ